MLLGPRYRGEQYPRGLDELAAYLALPRQYSGGIWTNRIETINPQTH